MSATVEFRCGDCDRVSLESEGPLRLDHVHISCTGCGISIFRHPAEKKKEEEKKEEPHPADFCELCGDKMESGTAMIGTGTGMAHKRCFKAMKYLQKNKTYEEQSRDYVKGLKDALTLAREEVTLGKARYAINERIQQGLS